ncbi:DJ-1/PfpI family protein [Vibrio renipiscarius]|uniref:Glutamine amidotransferase n=1 Tax=Vibrio renipiscarius TaxID=1461322 RepID=A0A0C2KGE2_9VIBR|nr:DJ-1/PfpI family protein [Vibrio renipiscarius]KII77484.1 glutamine amidotransferase [Vibrio renipiscarius]KII81348.1 glutamine amidotransferase [Vibrio renipiscarius]
MAKVLIIAGDFVEDYELMVPFQALQMLGHQVDVVCPDKLTGEQIKTAIHDFEGDQTYTEKVGHNFTLNHSFQNVHSTQYDALLIPGGRAPEYLRLKPDVINLVQAFYQEEKPIAAICHGAQLLTAANIIEGQSISAYPACKPEVELAGATYMELEMDQALTSGRFITAPAWPAHPAWLAQFNQQLT